MERERCQSIVFLLVVFLFFSKEEGVSGSVAVSLIHVALLR
jgi:hypothetical protein